MDEVSLLGETEVHEVKGIPSISFIFSGSARVPETIAP